MERKTRPIRLSDEEWSAFKLHFGPEWLRRQIDRAIKKDQRKPTVHKTEE